MPASGRQRQAANAKFGSRFVYIVPGQPELRGETEGGREEGREILPAKAWTIPLEPHSPYVPEVL